MCGSPISSANSPWHIHDMASKQEQHQGSDMSQDLLNALDAPCACCLYMLGIRGLLEEPEQLVSPLSGLPGLPQSLLADMHPQRTMEVNAHLFLAWS